MSLTSKLLNSLDRLEAAEKERDELRNEIACVKEVEFPRKAQAVADAWKGKCERLEAERDALRAELDALKAWKEEVEKQEPVAEVVWMAGLPNSMLEIQTYGSLTPPLGTKFYARPVPAPSVPEGWLRAIDEALVVTHLGVANAEDSYEDAKRKLDALIGWHCDVVTDPAVNGGWKLVPVEILDRFPEINQNNYNHDDVCNLNAWGVELVLAAEPKPEVK